jgi:hypothetical protein
MSTLGNDIKYALRNLIKHPGFTLVAVVTLALGIGANSSIFSVINALILTRTKIVDSDRVAPVWQTPIGSRKEGLVSYPDLIDSQVRNQPFETIAGYKPYGLVVLNNGEAERIDGLRNISSPDTGVAF